MTILKILRILGEWLLGLVVLAAMGLGVFTALLAAEVALSGPRGTAFLAVTNEWAIGAVLGLAAVMGCTVGVWWLGREALLMRRRVR